MQWGRKMHGKTGITTRLYKALDVLRGCFAIFLHFRLELAIVCGLQSEVAATNHSPLWWGVSYPVKCHEAAPSTMGQRIPLLAWPHKHGHLPSHTCDAASLAASRGNTVWHLFWINLQYLQIYQSIPIYPCYSCLLQKNCSLTDLVRVRYTHTYTVRHP